MICVQYNIKVRNVPWIFCPLSTWHSGVWCTGSCASLAHSNFSVSAEDAGTAGSV